MNMNMQNKMLHQKKKKTWGRSHKMLRLVLKVSHLIEFFKIGLK